MKTHIRRRENNRKLVIVFGGWGIDQNAFLPLCSEDHDFILYYNYSADEPLVLPDRKTYDLVILIGWSLGVWAAEYMSESMKLNPDLAIAVNGTPVPADDMYGIPLDVFEGTINNIDERGLEKYNIRLFGNKGILEENRDKLSKRSIDSLSSELRWLYNRIMESPDRKYRWDIALASLEDRIFPPSSMINYWKGRKGTQLITTHLPHYPFHQWATFNDMIQYLLQTGELNFTYW